MLDEDDHFYILEMGYRLPGDSPDAAFPEINGFDPVKWLVDCARGIKHTSKDLPPIQQHTYSKCGYGYSLWSRKSGTISAYQGFDEISRIPGIRLRTRNYVGDSFPQHRSLGVVIINADTIDEFCEKIDLVNKTVSILDENGEDVIIRYTDFEHLRALYYNGLSQQIL